MVNVMSEQRRKLIEQINNARKSMALWPKKWRDGLNLDLTMVGEKK